MKIRDLKPYVRQVDKKTVASPCKLPVRYLVAYQILIITVGEALIVFDDATYRVSAGDCFFIPPNKSHSYVIESEFECFFVNFDTHYSELSRVRNTSSSLPPDELPDYRKRYLQENIYENLPISFTPQSIDEYIECYFEIKDAVKKNNSFAAEARMIKMLNFFHEHMGIDEAKAEIDYCEAVRDYIDANFTESISLDKIADLYEVNKFTLSKKFKNEYGVSVISYYNQKRLEHAKDALKRGTLIRKIAEELNFYDEYAFSAFFKKHMGVSPRKYRSEKI